MKVYLLQVTHSDEEDREYFMPWYSEYFVFKTFEERSAKEAEILKDNADLTNDNLYTTELEMN